LSTLGIFDPIFTNKAIPNWYYTFTIPMLVPPNWIFDPLGFTLYVRRARWV
jgi:tryptophan-rich sensory protein